MSSLCVCVFVHLCVFMFLFMLLVHGVSRFLHSLFSMGTENNCISSKPIQLKWALLCVCIILMNFKMFYSFHRICTQQWLGRHKTFLPLLLLIRVWLLLWLAVVAVVVVPFLPPPAAISNGHSLFLLVLSCLHCPAKRIPLIWTMVSLVGLYRCAGY